MKVVCFGEALVDMLSSADGSCGNQNGSAGGAIEQFQKFPGGAPANAAVAVAKLGGDAYFAGMLGEDMFGRFLLQSLQREGVHTDYVRFTAAAKTGLAFVSLDAQGERSFEFYRPPAADLCFTRMDFHPDTFAGSGILHLCSNSLTEAEIAGTTGYAIERARAAGWLVSFDVNLRHNLWAGGRADRQRVQTVAAMADVLKMSAEEFDYLSAGRSDYQRELLRSAQLLLITDGGRPLRWHSRGGQGSVTPPPVTTVDATAAGDAFIGGFIYQLGRQQVAADTLGQWLDGSGFAEALAFACRCGAHAASLPGAFPSLPSQESLAAMFTHRS
ncbi:fructokinase [Microbulbifer aestuariivivens]|uniref:Fructokinase n=1 Tax=Microbulbifer aestuariivivens TaxID=1908308 RepID=A0ABP9WTB2_9GAMM